MHVVIAIFEVEKPFGVFNLGDGFDFDDWFETKSSIQERKLQLRISL